MGAAVLLVEDEPAIAEFLADNLRQDDCTVQTAGSIAEAIAALRRTSPDVALIDVGLPDGSGLELCRRIRAGEAGDPGIGLILVTARAEEQDRVRGFQRGADDYVVKPFHYPELLARVQALHARLAGRRLGTAVEVGEISIDAAARTVSLAGEPLHLPAKEFELLLTLARDPQRVFDKQDLLQRVWGYRDVGTTRTLDSHASRLRRRLEVGVGGRWIINHWGVGYALQAGA